jgi:hypothetical protein
MLLVGGGVLGLEWQYRRRPQRLLALNTGKWELEIQTPERYRLIGQMEFQNLTHRYEVMIPELTATVQLFSDASLDSVQWQAAITPEHPDAPARPDGYWFAYIVKTAKRTQFQVTLDITGSSLEALKSAWIQIHYTTYSPQGRIPKVGHVIFPLRYPDAIQALGWRSTSVADILPIKTHLLTHLDTATAVIKRYVSPHAQPGDIVTIGETPIAIMQERFRHPTEVTPGWVARRVCYYFLPTSSLATACGMQALVDIVGPWRVLFAFLGGAIAKAVLRRPGVFYQLAGEQARLIDDVTGTLPPYDQFIVLGPANPQAVVDQIQQETGLAAAVVDVNDLKAVKVLAASPKVSLPILEQALRDNPAGNADEQTPVVLIRPK